MPKLPPIDTDRGFGIIQRAEAARATVVEAADYAIVQAEDAADAMRACTSKDETVRNRVVWAYLIAEANSRIAQDRRNRVRDPLFMTIKTGIKDAQLALIQAEAEAASAILPLIRVSAHFERTVSLKPQDRTMT